MYRRLPHFPIDVVLGLTPQNTSALDTTKFTQKIREHTRWTWKKAEAVQVKEAECHKHNYDKCSRAVALEVGHMVLVHVTTFKGHHKIQDRWENREYVVEKLPYLNVPVYVVCPGDGEGHSQTLHRNYLLPISPNIGQDVKDKPIAGVEYDNSSTPVPLVDSEPADAGPSGTVTPRTAGSTPQGNPDQHAPLRCSVWKTWNWLPWQYQNFGLQADTSPSDIWDVWFGLHIYLHVILCLYTILWKTTVSITLHYYHLVSAKHYPPLPLRGTLLMQSLWWICGWWGSGSEVIWSEHR